MPASSSRITGIDVGSTGLESSFSTPAPVQKNAFRRLF
jgi:hypothetical protein